MATSLQEQIDRYNQQGYRVLSQTAEGVQMVKPKAFSFVWAVLWFLLFGVGVLIYIFYYMAKKDQTVFLRREENSPVATQSAPEIARPASSALVADELRALKQLLDDGLITEAEYEVKRKAIAERL